MPLFSTGIKREPNRFMVPRTVMIGGKVRDLGQTGWVLNTCLDSHKIKVWEGQSADPRLPHRLHLGTTWPR